MGRFDVARVQVEIAGPQKFVLDAHITTRADEPSEFVTATLASAVIYLYDLAAVRAFSSAWSAAMRYVPVGMPEQLTPWEEFSDNSVGLLFRVEGTPRRRRINGIAAAASPLGKPFVRVEVGPLVVHAHDLVSIRSIAESWAEAERLGLRVWGEGDAFTQTEVQEQKRIARTGRAAERKDLDP